MTYKHQLNQPTLTTYERADGEPIAGEFDFVTQLEWFEDDDEPTELIKRTWHLVEVVTMTVNEPEGDTE